MTYILLLNLDFQLNTEKQYLLLSLGKNKLI